MSTRARLVVLLAMLIGVAAGCAPKTPVTENPGTSVEISAMVKAMPNRRDTTSTMQSCCRGT